MAAAPTGLRTLKLWQRHGTYADDAELILGAHHDHAGARTHAGLWAATPYRMPAILRADDHEAWSSGRSAAVSRDRMQAYRVMSSRSAKLRRLRNRVRSGDPPRYRDVDYFIAPRCSALALTLCE